MGIVVKATLVAAVVLIGYNLNQLLTSYEVLCEKMKEFKGLVQSENANEISLRKTNLLLTGALSMSFVALTYFSDFAYWVVLLVAAKLAISIYLSQLEITLVFKKNFVEKSFFKLTKVDALVNVLAGFAVAVIAIA